MTDSAESHDDKMPDDDELQEPSTEKDMAEEPKDPDTDGEAPDHQAVGVGVDGTLPADSGAAGDGDPSEEDASA
jgi:hypothetical protein